MRIKHTVAAAVAILALAACGSNTAGNAVAGGGVAPTSGGAFGSVVATEPSQPPIPAGPTDPTPTDPAPTDPSPTDPAPTAPESSTGSSESASPAATKDTVPEDMCDLMPASLSKGLEKDIDKPRSRTCDYTSKGGPFISARLSFFDNQSLKPDIAPDNPNTTKPESVEIDGRRGFTYIITLTSLDAKTSYLAMEGGEGILLLSYSNPDRSDEQNSETLQVWAEGVSKAVRAGTPIEGMAEPPPSTVPLKIPAGQRGWPGVICDLMPEELMTTMEVSEGYERQSCVLTKDTDKTGLTIRLGQSSGLREPDPSLGMGRDLKTDTLDGRTVYSWLSSSENSPTVYVAFSTGERTSAELSYSYFDVTTKINPEDTRAKALDLAKQIASKLPLP